MVDFTIATNSVVGIDQPRVFDIDYENAKSAERPSMTGYQLLSEHNLPMRHLRIQGD